MGDLPERVWYALAMEISKLAVAQIVIASAMLAPFARAAVRPTSMASETPVQVRVIHAPGAIAPGHWVYPVGKIAKRLGLMQCWSCFVCRNQPATRYQFAGLVARVIDRAGWPRASTPLLTVEELVLVERALRYFYADLEQMISKEDKSVDAWGRTKIEVELDQCLFRAWCNTIQARSSIPMGAILSRSAIRGLCKEPQKNKLFELVGEDDILTIGMNRLFRSDQPPGCGPRTAWPRPSTRYQILVSLDRCLELNQPAKGSGKSWSSTQLILRFLAETAVMRASGSDWSWRPAE